MGQAVQDFRTSLPEPQSKLYIVSFSHLGAGFLIARVLNYPK